MDDAKWLILNLKIKQLINIPIRKMSKGHPQSQLIACTQL